MVMTTHVRRLGVVTLVAICACGSGAKDQPADTAPPPTSSLQGAWHLAEFRPAGGASVSNPPSVFLFGDGHYSVTYVNTADTKRNFAKPDSATNADKVRAFDTFISNAGTYMLAGDTLVIRPLVSKHPNYMGGGEDKFVARHAGDTLVLTEVPGSFRWANGQPAAGAATSDAFTLIRIR
jgi:hypothetical protein